MRSCVSQDIEEEEKATCEGKERNKKKRTRDGIRGGE
jgi:hypothetical protein